MEGINERIYKLIKALEHNPNSFAKSIGKAQSSVAAIVEGRSKPGFEFLELICSTYPQVSRDWLLMGEGDLFKKSTKAIEPADYLKEYLQGLEKKFIQLLETKDRQLEVKDRQMEGMQRTIDSLLTGKLNGVSRRPKQASPSLPLMSTNLFTHVPTFE